MVCSITNFPEFIGFMMKTQFLTRMGMELSPAPSTNLSCPDPVYFTDDELNEMVFEADIDGD